MTASTLYFIFIAVISALLLLINIILAPHNPYAEKNNPFECGFLSFLWQNRIQFSISFFIFALLFLLFDLEILLVYPYLVSSYGNEIYGLITMLFFLLVLVIGFAFELGKKALTIESRQTKKEFSDLQINNTDQLYISFATLNKGNLYILFKYLILTDRVLNSNHMVNTYSSIIPYNTIHTIWLNIKKSFTLRKIFIGFIIIFIVAFVKLTIYNIEISTVFMYISLLGWFLSLIIELFSDEKIPMGYGSQEKISKGSQESIADMLSKPLLMESGESSRSQQGLHPRGRMYRGRMYRDWSATNPPKVSQPTQSEKNPIWPEMTSDTAQQQADMDYQNAWTVLEEIKKYSSKEEIETIEQTQTRIESMKNTPVKFESTTVSEMKQSFLGGGSVAEYVKQVEDNSMEASRKDKNLAFGIANSITMKYAFLMQGKGDNIYKLSPSEIEFLTRLKLSEVRLKVQLRNADLQYNFQLVNDPNQDAENRYSYDFFEQDMKDLVENLFKQHDDIEEVQSVIKQIINYGDYFDSYGRHYQSKDLLHLRAHLKGEKEKFNMPLFKVLVSLYKPDQSIDINDKIMDSSDSETEKSDIKEIFDKKRDMKELRDMLDVKQRQRLVLEELRSRDDLTPQQSATFAQQFNKLTVEISNINTQLIARGLQVKKYEARFLNKGIESMNLNENANANANANENENANANVLANVYASAIANVDVYPNPYANAIVNAIANANANANANADTNANTNTNTDANADTEYNMKDVIKRVEKLQNLQLFRKEIIDNGSALNFQGEKVRKSFLPSLTRDINAYQSEFDFNKFIGIIANHNPEKYNQVKANNEKILENVGPNGFTLHKNSEINRLREEIKDKEKQVNDLEGARDLKSKNKKYYISRKIDKLAEKVRSLEKSDAGNISGSESDSDSE